MISATRGMVIDGDLRAPVQVAIGLLAAAGHRPYPRYIARWSKEWGDRPLYDPETDTFVLALERHEASNLIALLAGALRSTAGDVGYDEMDGG